MADWKLDGAQILSRMEPMLGQTWDLKTALVQMKDEGSNQWRQSEWQGFYLEHLLFRDGSTEFKKGPTYGNVAFDLQRLCVWDLKVHVAKKNIVPLNDQEAILACLKDHHFLGWIILEGAATYTDSSLKVWHSTFKGKETDYVKQQRARGASSRPLKATFTPTKITCFGLEGPSSLERALKEGWLTEFQRGMRNSNGVGRRPKYKAHLNKIPDWASL
jgi:hypothetical protein